MKIQAERNIHVVSEGEFNVATIRHRFETIVLSSAETMASTNEDSAIAAAEAALGKLSKNDLTEIRSYTKPPLACLTAFEAVGVLIDPSKTTWEWADDKSLLIGGPAEFVKKLLSVDKDHLTKEQLARLESILDRDDCQPNVLEPISPFFQHLSRWLRAVYAYASARQ